MEHYQNYDGNLIQPQDTPNTPQNLMRNNRYRSMYAQYYANSLFCARNSEQKRMRLELIIFL